MTRRLVNALDMTPADSQQVAWKVGNEFAPFHPSASHIEPAYRDGWNACYRASLAVAQPADIGAAAFESAMREAWQMVDGLHPEGQPGSYARGSYNGIVAALQTVRQNYDRAASALAASPVEPVAWRCDWTEWRQYHDEQDPMPQWDSLPHPVVTPLYAHPIPAPTETAQGRHSEVAPGSGQTVGRFDESKT